MELYLQTPCLSPDYGSRLGGLSVKHIDLSWPSSMDVLGEHLRLQHQALIVTITPSCTFDFGLEMFLLVRKHDGIY